MRVELLGTMRVLVDGKPLPKVRSQKAKWLLALLALRDGKPAGRTVFASILWPDNEAAAALTNLRSVIGDLRRALGDQADRLLVPDRRTLSFDLEGVEVDALAFDAAIKARDWETAAKLYTGPFLQDCDEEWARPERNTRERACLVAFHELAQKAEPETAIHLCQRAVEVSPWQDVPRRDLMEAYARTNDLNAALGVYRDFAHALRSESGGVPDAQTTDLYMRLRSGLTSPARAEPMIPASLPGVFNSFVGREDERIELAQAIRGHRLITLSGLGGIGKTRLAREVAFDVRSESPDGVVFVALEAIQNEAALIQAVVAGFWIKLAPSMSPLRGLIETLKNKDVLLILDNCEHLVSACAKLADLLLIACPEVRILATSREPLCLPGELVWPVPSLTTPELQGLPRHPATLLRVLSGYESIQLFVERAQAAAKSFELTRDNASEVAELCVLLEGSPLAIELAAGRVRTMSVPDILERFRHHRLDFLAGNRHTGAPRHQTLRATIDWSYSLLGADERRLFARLAVFSGGWTLEAAEAVTGATPTLLESLVEKSLVKFSPNGRYSFLETVREYAAEILAAANEASDVRKRHTDYYVTHAERLFETMATIETVQRELTNFNEAMDREENDPETAIRLVLALSKYWRRTFSIQEGCRRIEAALGKAGPKPTPLRAKALHRLAVLRSHIDRKTSISVHEEGLRLWRELGDTLGTAQALHWLGIAALYAGEYQRAEEFVSESISLSKDCQDYNLLAFGLGLMAVLSLRPGDYVKANALAFESLDLMRRVAGIGEIAGALRTVASIAYELSDYDAFQRHNEEALALYRSAGEEGGTAWCMGDLGKAATDLGQTTMGQDLLEQALDIIRKVEDRYGIASILEYLGMNAIARGDIDEARRLLIESTEGFRMLDHRFGIVRNLDALGDASRQEGNPDADSYYRESLAIWREIGHRKRIRDGLLRIGDGMGDPDRSIRLWAFAHRLGETIGAPIPLPMRNRHELAMRIARDKPGFEAAWEDGWNMSFDTTFELALTS